MPYQLGLGIAAGLLSALLFLSPLITGAGVLFFCLAPLPLFVAGLGLGGSAPWLAVVVALVATAAKGWGWSVS
ncbi:MAG: hypothetical protein K2Q10_02610, partial [Rhodospirillales bacterium]|nr:hypothetical protein [Rhodospirillales bacterium]